MTEQGRQSSTSFSPPVPRLDDPAWLARARRYRRERLRWLLVHLVVGLAVSGLAIVLRLPAAVHEWMVRRLQGRPVADLVSIATYLTGGWLLGMPSRAWHDLVLERRYELSTQRAPAWLVDQLKALALRLPVETLLGFGIVAAVRRWPRRWWLALSLASAPLTVLFSFLFPVVIAPRFNRYRPLTDQALAERLREQAAAAGIEVSAILVTDLSRRTRKANAFVTGLGRTRRIVLGDTLLASFPPDEVAVVLAHELAHQAHRDLWRLILASMVQVTLTAWLVQRAAERIARRFGRRLGAEPLDQPAALPLLAWLATLAGLTLMPAANAFSRHLERRADRFVLELTGDASAFVRAMARLAVQNLSDPAPPRLERWLLASHPAFTERIAAAERLAQKHHPS